MIIEFDCKDVSKMSFQSKKKYSWNIYEKWACRCFKPDLSSIFIPFYRGFLLFWGLTASRYSGQRFSLTPYITPRLTPTGTPKVISTTESPRGYSAAGSPKKTSGATSPTKIPQSSLSVWYSSSQQSSAANSPPRGRPIPGLEDPLLIYYK